MEAIVAELLALPSPPPDGSWALVGGVEFQPEHELAIHPPEPPAALPFSARAWQEGLPHGLSLARRAALTPYDLEALELFREWARAEEEYARALGKALLAPTHIPHLSPIAALLAEALLTPEGGGCMQGKETDASRRGTVPRRQAA
eukprot:scaffold219863_cov32-Tisochrysis_lutea.AAC.6